MKGRKIGLPLKFWKKLPPSACLSPLPVVAGCLSGGLNLLPPSPLMRQQRSAWQTRSGRFRKQIEQTNAITFIWQQAHQWKGEIRRLIIV